MPVNETTLNTIVTDLEELNSEVLAKQAVVNKYLNIMKAIQLVSGNNPFDYGTNTTMTQGRRNKVYEACKEESENIINTG